MIYEHLLLKCGSCGFTGHSATQCRKPRKQIPRPSSPSNKEEGRPEVPYNGKERTMEQGATSSNVGIKVKKADAKEKGIVVVTNYKNVSHNISSKGASNSTVNVEIILILI